MEGKVKIIKRSSKELGKDSNQRDVQELVEEYSNSKGAEQSHVLDYSPRDSVKPRFK